MLRDAFTFQASDHKTIHVYQWLPDDRIARKGVVQISHGMAEHAKRYEGFAEFLTNAGFAVYGNDHRGHGKTAGNEEDYGYFADENGWNLVVNDARQLTQIIKTKHPSLPVFMLGHSMGSFIIKSYIQKYGAELKGILLSGTSADPGVLASLGILVCKWEVWTKGKRGRSPLMDRLTFGDFNRKFKPNRTDYDWLNRDEKEVDQYLEDPWCGGVFTAGFFYDLLTGMRSAHDPINNRSVPKNLPIYLFSGARDPVGQNTKLVLKSFHELKQAGVQDILCKFYEDGRHEIMLELNRQEVYQDILNWLHAHL